MARILGLDIGTTAIRGTVIRSALRRVEVLQYVEMPVIPTTNPEDRLRQVQDSIRSVISAIRPPPDGIIAALDGEDASVRPIELPAAAAKRIGEVLPFELESLIPFSADEAVIDYQTIEIAGGKIRLLVCAVPKTKVAARLAELREAGVEPRNLGVGAAALDGLVPLVPMLSTPGPFVIVDVGQHHTDLCIIRNGHAEWARTTSTGLGTLPRGADALARDVQQTIMAYRAAGNPAPVQVLVGGGGAGAYGVMPFLEGKLQMPVEPVPLPEAPGADPSIRASFTRSSALAGRTISRGRHLDLLQGEFAAKRTMGALRQQAPLMAICGAVVLGCFFFATAARWWVLDDEREVLEEELARATRDTLGEESREITRARELLTKGRGGADPLPAFDAFDVLDVLSTKIPPEVTHETRRLHIELEDDGREGRFEIQGSVGSIEQRDQISAALGEHECIQELEQGRTSPGVGNQNVNYQLEAVVRCPGMERPATKNRRPARGQ
jgi:general secretion pathway protein L